jgi:hypothetical protein
LLIADSGVSPETTEYLAMWIDTSRRRHSRSELRYPSDLRDCEWAQIEPPLPPAKPGGRPRCTDLREVMNAIWTCNGFAPVTYLIMPPWP